MTNDDLQSFDGDVGRLMGLIQRKTGAGRESVECFLNEVTAKGAWGISEPRLQARVSNDELLRGFHSSLERGDSIMGGKSDEVKGRIKEAAGALTGNDKLRDEGKTDQAVGKVKQVVENAVDAVKEAADKVADKTKQAAKKI
jgi:uncharacterized protein YjbJ (UPF0337 family)